MKTNKLKTTNPPKKSDKKTQINLLQFKSWLEGFLEMQSDDWSPDLMQWKKIREKIDLIEENPRSFKSGGAGPSYDEGYPAPVYAASPPAQSGFAVSQPTMSQPMIANPPMFMNTSGAEGARLKTPNVDTSKQPYASSLE